MGVIQWCNDNSGFTSAILATMGLLLSSIAIIVSIHTARLPYRKRIRLSATTDFHFFKNSLSGEADSKVAGISVKAVNLSFRNINLTYLGIAAKDHKKFKGFQKIVKINGQPTGIGTMASTEEKTESFQKDDLLFWLQKLSPKAKIFICAIDSEGKKHTKKIGISYKIIKGLSVV